MILPLLPMPEVTIKIMSNRVCTKASGFTLTSNCIFLDEDVRLKKRELKQTPSFIIGGDSSDESDSETVETVSVETQTDLEPVTAHHYQSHDSHVSSSEEEPRPLEECVQIMKSDVSIS